MRLDPERTDHAVIEAWDEGPTDRHIQVYEDVWQALKGTNGLSVYMALKRRVNPNNHSWYSTRATLADEAGVSLNTFDKFIKELAEMGLVGVIPRYVPKGWGGDPDQISEVRTKTHRRQVGNRYRIRFHLPSSYRPQEMGTPTPTQEMGTPDTSTQNMGTQSPQNLGSTSTQKLGNRHITHIHPTEEPPKPPKGQAADAAENVIPGTLDLPEIVDAEIVPDAPAPGRSLAVPDGQAVMLPGIGGALEVVTEPKLAPKKRGQKRQIPGYTQAFEQFWALYPAVKKGGKIRAFELWLETIHDEQVAPSRLLKAVEDYARYSQAMGDDPRFIRQPPRWFEEKGWEDELEIPQQAKLSRHTLDAAFDQHVAQGGGLVFDPELDWM